MVAVAWEDILEKHHFGFFCSDLFLGSWPSQAEKNGGRK